MRFVEGESYVIQPVQSPRQAVQQLRIVKSPKEIEAMRKTAEIGSKGQLISKCPVGVFKPTKEPIFFLKDFCLSHQKEIE